MKVREYKSLQFNHLQWQVFPLSEEAILLECDQSTPIQTIHICSKQIEEILGEDLLDIVTAYHSITVFSKFSMDELIQTLNGSIRQIAENKNEDSSSAIRIPICYDFAMDLDRIAVHTKFSKDEIIERHISATYQAIVIGFTPGFVYAEGLDQALSCPRLSNPRSSLPAGSVGIGGNQTGIY